MIPGTGKGAGFLSSFRYACEGLSASFKGRNFRIQVGVAALAIFLCWLLRVSCVESCVVLICIGLVLAGECLNTALEAVVDLVCPKIHPVAKLAKDCAAAAVLVLSAVSSIIALIIFVPKLF